MSRKEQKAATRASLKRAALLCFEEKGYSGTTMGDITRAAGVADGTFYVHFSSREELVDELLEEFNLEFVGLLQPLMGRIAEDPLPRLIRMAAEESFRHFEKRAGFVRIYAERSIHGFDLSSLPGGLNPPMARLLNDMLKNAGGKDVHWDLVSQALLGMWLRIGLQFLFSTEITIEQAVDTFSAMCAGAVAALLE